MQLKRDTPVQTATGQSVGHIDRVVLDPASKEVTHIVVRKGLFFTQDKVVPIGLVAAATEAQVTLREDAEFTKQYPAKWNCRLVAETLSGKRHEVHVTYPKGHPENPFSDTEVEEKFMRLAAPSLGEIRCRD